MVEETTFRKKKQGDTLDFGETVFKKTWKQTCTFAKKSAHRFYRARAGSLCRGRLVTKVRLQRVKQDSEKSGWRRAQKNEPPPLPSYASWKKLFTCKRLTNFSQVFLRRQSSASEREPLLAATRRGKENVLNLFNETGRNYVSALEASTSPARATSGLLVRVEF